MFSRSYIPLNLMGWVWAWQSAVRSSKLTMDVCGSRQTRHEAQFFSSRCHASRLDWAAPWSGLACEADGTPELFLPTQSPVQRLARRVARQGVISLVSEACSTEGGRSWSVSFDAIRRCRPV